MGDAAHAMYPSLGQGAAQGIEDAAALSVLLPLGTTRESIPARLEAFQSIRKERADAVAQESIDQWVVKEKIGLLLRSVEVQDWTMGYDAFGEAETQYREMYSS